jgi:hypothetical protein
MTQVFFAVTQVFLAVTQVFLAVTQVFLVMTQVFLMMTQILLAVTYHSIMMISLAFTGILDCSSIAIANMSVAVLHHCVTVNHLC